MSEQGQLDFSAVLASTIHDMKNSLGMVLNSLDQIVDLKAGNCNCSAEQVAQLQYEARRVNDNLVQLLTLYKLENGRHLQNISELPVAEFLEECYLLNKPLIDYKGIGIEIECDDDLYWFFDRDLSAGVVNNVINNAMRYTRDRIRLSASVRDGMLDLRIEDNGPGFPERMLEVVGREQTEVDFRKGHTGLGLYFCTKVAESHENQGRYGRIELANDSPIGGGRFSVILP